MTATKVANELKFNEKLLPFESTNLYDRVHTAEEHPDSKQMKKYDKETYYMLCLLYPFGCSFSWFIDKDDNINNILCTCLQIA